MNIHERLRPWAASSSTSTELSLDAIREAIDAVTSGRYRPTTTVISPRAAHALVRWYRWIDLTSDIVWADPRWPKFIRRRLIRYRMQLARARFEGWLAKHPYTGQAVPRIPGAITSQWLPWDLLAVEFVEFGLDDLLWKPDP